MPETLTTTVSELPESRVRVQVTVAPAEIAKQVQRKARELGGKLKIPGFRRGKVPPALVIQRLGREAVLDEAIRDALADWYSDALRQAQINAVGDPSLDLGALPADGEQLQFSIEIGVLPKAELGEYKGLEVGRREVAVAEEQVDEEIEKLRERLAKLETVTRAAERGDFVVIDYVGSIDGTPFAGGEGRDQLVELGGGNLIPGFEDGLLGAAGGQQRTLEVTFPSDYGSRELAGKAASFAVTVKDVKQKQIPDVDEDFAADLGFDSVADLRADVRGRLEEAEQATVERDFRQAVLDAATANARVEVPESLARSRAREMWERTLHSLSHRGISKEAYLQIASQSEQEILAEITPDAEQALRREALIAAVIEAEQIKPSDEEVRAALAPTAEREGIEPQQLLAKLADSERLEELRDELAAQQALELLVAAAKAIDLEQAKAREKLWTPEQAEQQSAGAGEKLWTPES